jgi:DNA-binding NtrC family response regulator
MSNVQVLVVDDDPDVRGLMGKLLSREGVQISLAGDGRHALALMERQPFQVLFTDLCMPGMDGLAVLRRALQVCPQLSAVVFTGHARLDSCVEAMRLGACDYVTKPFTPQDIRGALARALDVFRGKGGAQAIVPADYRDETEDFFIAESAVMCEVRDLAAKVATTDAAVLIHGEAGAGKDLVARAIHRQSRHAGGAFVLVNCGAIREAELDARLFGPNRQDLAGDDQVRWGLLQESHGGTIFLSNVEHLPRWAQARLYDVLGGSANGPAGSRLVPCDARLIASTACDLEAAVAEGRFHGGLYYRLQVVDIHVPPLRLRHQDLKILAERYLARVLAKQGVAADQRPYRFAEEAWQCLLHHDWPGNLPELANVVARAVAMADNHEIGVESLALTPRKAKAPGCDTIAVPLTGNLQAMERQIIDEVIQRHRGNKAAAARVLGLHRRTLYRMLEETTGDTPPEKPR